MLINGKRKEKRRRARLMDKCFVTYMSNGSASRAATKFEAMFKREENDTRLGD